MKKHLHKTISRGQGLIEYLLLIVLVIMGITVALELTGYSVRDVYCNVAENLGAENVCAEEQIYCQDDFSTMEGWESRYGKWTNPDGKICTSRGARNYNTCSESMQNNSDYTIKLGGAELTQGNGYGVFFRGTEMDGRTDGYIVQYDPGWGGGAIIMRKWVNGRELPPFAVKRLPGFDWYGGAHDIQLDVQGNTFTLSIDGEEVLVGQDDTYSEGGVGFRSWDNTKVCFDDISIGELSTSVGDQ